MSFIYDLLVPPRVGGGGDDRVKISHTMQPNFSTDMTMVTDCVNLQGKNKSNYL